MSNPYDQKPASPSDDEALSFNLFAPLLGLIAIALLAGVVWALDLAGRQSADAPADCTAIVNDRTRLACFDKLAVRRQPAKGAIWFPHANSRAASP
jgi:hypothetical protein